MATGHLSLLEVLSIWILVASKMDGRSSSSTHKVDVLTCKKHRQAGKKMKGFVWTSSHQNMSPSLQGEPSQEGLYRPTQRHVY